MFNYKPLLIERAEPESFTAPAYRRFVFETAIEPGVRLLLARHRRRPEWPFVDTKFNPNTGRQLDESAYQYVHGWFLGRGSEALAGHVARLEEMRGLTPTERAEARELFTRINRHMCATIVQAFERYDGRCPFRVGLDLTGRDAHNRPLTAADLPPDGLGAAEMFCMKGLIAAGDAAQRELGLRSLLRIGERVLADRYTSDQFAAPLSAEVSHGSRMLMQGAVALAGRKAAGDGRMKEIRALGARMLTEALDRHFDLATLIFSESIDRATGARGSQLDPGHATELVGLGLSAVSHLAAAGELPAVVARARRDLPRLLFHAFERGWNRRLGGLYKTVDNRTGEPLTDEMPWWNLPETMRAAALAYPVAADAAERRRCLEILRDCHNAYFSLYPNPDNMLFPFQTISGETGKVLDRVPAVPEGDPLYHTNLSVLEMLDWIGRW